uniref:Death domain-containing protein n=1 Tax=Amphimedon queenslandica TaxID=400682 RepID=A0A1X7USY7_AMPQE
MQLVLGNALLTNRSKMRLFEIIVSVLVGGFAVAFALSLFVEERALSLQVLVVLVLLLLAFVAIKYWNSSGTTIKYKRVQPPLKNEKPLNTTDLNKILTLLEKYQYSGKSYYRLGLSLGLLHRTLDIIKTDNNNSVEHCLREVLTKWLEKADNVEKPTWSALVAALRSINQNAVAEEIDRETDPVSLIIENHRDALSQSIQENLTQIARHLSYELEIKSLESLHGSPSEKIEVLLKTIKNAVYENYKSILKFADVLCKFPAVRSVRNDIQKNYSEKIVDNSIEVRAMGRNGDPIKVPLNFSLECKEMRNKWAIAVDSAIKVIAVEVEEQELKGFLQIQTSNSDVKEKLNACHSTGEIMQIIIDHCSLVDLTLLEGIIERFKIEEAKEHINEYKEIKDDFCSISLHSLLNETIGYPSSLKCETLQLSVDKSIDERTLKDVQDLIAIAFESFALNVRIAVIKEGNSFTITCSFPLALSESLIATALKNLEQLKKEGLIKMTIGYSTVYSQNKTKMETVEKFKKLIFSPLTSTWSSHLEREKSQHITSVYNSSGTMKQLLVSLNVQLINCEASSNEERKVFQDLLAEKTALVKKVENEGDSGIQELKLVIKEKQDEIKALQFSLRDATGATRLQELKLMIEEKQVEIKALQFSLSNATERGNIAAEENKELNERIETQLRISRAKDQKIEDLKAAAIREKIEMTKTEKDYELQIEALKTAMKENEKIIEQSGIKDLSIIIREKDKAIAELQELIMGGNLEASSDPESQIKYLNIIIREKDKTIAELQHLDEMAHLEESSDSGNLFIVFKLIMNNYRLRTTFKT